MLTGQAMRTYRAVRVKGWNITDAVRFAKADTALCALEFEGKLWFTREPDEDFEPFGDLEVIEFEVKGFADGSLEVFGIVAHTPDNDHAASLWGIVNPIDERYYPRYVEISLAMEIGLLDMPMPFVRNADGR